MTVPASDILITAAAATGAFGLATAVHERNWRRLLAEYAELRRVHGAPSDRWPSGSLTHVLSVKPALLALLAVVAFGGAAVGGWAALAWPQPAPFTDAPVVDSLVPLVWAAAGIGIGLSIALGALALFLARSPWYRVSRQLHRAIYAREEARQQLLAAALCDDPWLTTGSLNDC